MKIKKIVILGGEVTGCAVAASLAHALQNTEMEISVIDTNSVSSKTPTDSQTSENYSVETLSPQTQVFHELLGLNEARVLAFAQGSFSFGSLFRNWQNPASGFLQTYDNHGVNFNNIGFQHFYVRFREQLQNPPFDKFSLSALAALKGRFSHPSNDQRSVLSTLNYGLNLAGKPYSQILRMHAEHHGARFVTGNFIKAIQNNEGMVKQIVLDNGTIDGDFFVDCSGRERLLLGTTLGIPEIDWSPYFPYNRRADFILAHKEDLPSVSSITAHKHYWLKSVPLRQHSVNSLIFDRRYLNEEDVKQIAGNEEIKLHSLFAGRMDHLWHQNVIAFGEAGVNLEHFTFSKMDLLYRNIQSFLSLLPTDNRCQLNAEEYNRVTVEHYEQLKDYHLCHQLLAGSHLDSAFWQACRAAPLSGTLQTRLELFRRRSTLIPHDREIIPAAMWVSLLLGLGVLPEDYDPLVDILNSNELVEKIKRMQMIMEQAAEKMPKHSDYLEYYLRTHG